MSKITIKNNMGISKKGTEDTCPKVEVRIHDSLKGNLKQETGVPKITMNFPGKISKVMNINTLKIQKMEERLRKYQELADKFCEGNLAILLGGDSQLSEANYDFQFNSPSFHKQFCRTTKCNNKNGVITPLHEEHETRFNVNEPRDLNFYKNRYKFYFSLRLDSEESKKRCEEFFTELFLYLSGQDIYVTSKTFDHNYDGFNLYTSDLLKTKVKIEELYQKYKRYNFFEKVPHFFQGSLDRVDPDHIGFVQEPHGKVNSDSHSTRMMRLGQKIQEGKSYYEACIELGLNPEAPWLLTESYFDEMRLTKK